MPGRGTGVKNYKNDKLMDILEVHLPTGADQWKNVAKLYKISSGEEFERDYADIKKHFYTRLCNNGAKPTGSKTLTPSQDRALKIFVAMQRKESACTVAEEEDDLNFAEEEGDEEADEEVSDEEIENTVEFAASPPAPPSKRPKIGMSSSSSISTGTSPIPIPPPQKSKNVKIYNSNSKRAGTMGVMKEMVEVMRDNGANQQMLQFMQLQQQQLDRLERDRERADKERGEFMAMIAQLIGMPNQRLPAFDRLPDLRARLGIPVVMGQQPPPQAPSSTMLDDFVNVQNMPTQPFEPQSP
jgi:hypothetical protein